MSEAKISAKRYTLPAPEMSVLRCTNSVTTTATTIDLNWTGRPRSIAAALLESDGHRAILDPGPSSTLATLREQLRARGLSVQDLDTILLTHIHLDHAGAAGSLVHGHLFHSPVLSSLLPRQNCRPSLPSRRST